MCPTEPRAPFHLVSLRRARPGDLDRRAVPKRGSAIAVRARGGPVVVPLAQARLQHGGLPRAVVRLAGRRPRNASEGRVVGGVMCRGRGQELHRGWAHACVVGRHVGRLWWSSSSLASDPPDHEDDSNDEDCADAAADPETNDGGRGHAAAGTSRRRI